MTDDAIRCPNCFSPEVRPARLKLSDAPHFIFLRRPIRCRSCNERFYAWYWEPIYRGGE